MRCAALIALTSLVCASLAFSGFGDVVSSFPVPEGVVGRGLAWDGTDLWFCGEPSVYVFRTTTLGSIVSSFKTEEPYPSEIESLTFDGEYLWYSAYRRPGFYRYTRVTTTGSEVKAFGVGYGDPGLAWEPPRYLWVGPIKVTTTGSRVASFNPPFYLGSDLAWYGHYLWNGGPKDRVYQISNHGSVIASFPVPGGAAAGAMTFDGNYLWLVNPTADYVYQVDIDVVGMNPGSFGKIKGLYR